MGAGTADAQGNVCILNATATGCISETGNCHYQAGCTACAQFQAIQVLLDIAPDVRSKPGGGNPNPNPNPKLPCRSVTAVAVQSHFKKQLLSRFLNR